MSFIQQKKDFILGFALGVGAGLITRDLIPGISKSIRPTIKLLIMNGITLVEKFRESMARAGETIEDLTAEVNLELKERPKKHKRGRPRKNETP